MEHCATLCAALENALTLPGDFAIRSICLLGDRLAAGLRTLTPPTKVRILVPQPYTLYGDSYGPIV